MQRARRQIAKRNPNYEFSSKAFLIMISTSRMKYRENPPELEDLTVFSLIELEFVAVDELNSYYKYG